MSYNSIENVDLKRSKRVLEQAPVIDRLPPHSPECERGVLGCILLSPGSTIDESVDVFGTAGRDAFYDLRHGMIFEAMTQMREDEIPIDVVTVYERLKALQQHEQVGGLAYLASLPDDVPSAANLSYYLDVVKEKFVIRQMITTCTDVVAGAYDFQGSIDELVDDVQREMLKIGEFSKAAATPSMVDSIKKAIETIEDMHQNRGIIRGVRTGFIDFDHMTSGLCPGDLVVIAARPSMGKTSLAMNIAEHVAVDQMMPVGVFSQEMTRDSLVLRMLCSRARVNLRNVKDGFLADRDFPKLTGAAGRLAEAPIYIEDSSGISIMQLRSKARRMTQQFGIKLFVIDYLQLLTAFIGRKRIENRQQEIAEISGGIKALAKELQVPIIVLSQLNRDLDKQKRKPVLADLRESGAIEQDADIVGLLYKPTTEDDNVAEYVEAVPINLIIAKQRNGATGEVNLTFLKSYTRFENAGKVVPEQQYLA